MSTISDILKKAHEVEYLIEIDFEGLIKRYAAKNISVPYTGYGAIFFEAAIINAVTFGSKLDLNSMTYGLQNISVVIQNKDRLQDEEARRRLDNGTATVYLWAPGLTWADIESAGVVMRGTFQKKDYDLYQFNFSIVEQPYNKILDLPPHTINTDTWANHRSAGSAGSVAGLPQQIVFGDWARGVPVLCVDTVGFKYLAMAGVALSTDAEYQAGTEDIFDIDDAVIDPAISPYTFYPSGIDEEGNPCAYFDFVDNPVNTDPKHCSIRGLTDGSGAITGTAGALIEHPADIIHYLLEQYTTLTPDEIDLESIKTMRTLLPGLKFAVIVNDPVGALDVIDRILYQCQYARIQRRGKVGLVGLHTDAPDLSRAKSWSQIGRTVSVASTPDSAVCNALLVRYNLNPFTKRYESEFVVDRTNNNDCNRSYHQYGQRAQKTLTLVDVQQEPTARSLANRYIELNAYRHEIAEINTPVAEGFDALEGDCGLVACAEGTGGWTDEPCLLLDKTFNGPTIIQRWWKIVA